METVRSQDKTTDQISEENRLAKPIRREAKQPGRTDTESDVADDLVQAAVKRGLERRSQWRPGTRLVSWMFTIMRNAWIDETRSRGRRGRLFAPPEAGEHVAGSDGEAVHARLEAREVAAAMGRLPEDQRLAVALVLVEGLSYQEAAEILDIPKRSLSNRLARGCQALLAHLEGGVAA